MNQLRSLIAAQAETMKQFEPQSQQFASQQQEKYIHKQRAQLQKFDGVIRDKDEVIQSLRQELANNRERHLQEPDQVLQDAERKAQQPSTVYAAASTQPYATPVEKKTLHADVAVARVAPTPAFDSKFHSPELSLGASASNLNTKSSNKDSSAMVVPVRRRLQTKTPPAASSKYGVGEEESAFERTTSPVTAPDSRSSRLLRELRFSYCSSREMPFREFSKLRELIQQHPGTL